MTDLKDVLLDDMKIAMKKKKKKRLSVIRMARAAIKNEEIKKRKDLDDEEVIEVLAREVKQHRDSIKEFEKNNRDDRVEELKKEINILLEYLPEQLSDEDISNMIDEVISETNSSSMADMGKVMGKIIPMIKGRADASKVSEFVKSRLQ